MLRLAAGSPSGVSLRVCGSPQYDLREAACVEPSSGKGSGERAGVSESPEQNKTMLMAIFKCPDFPDFPQTISQDFRYSLVALPVSY